MIICLEGPDGGGKSTLADSISQFLGGPNRAPIIKRGPLKQDPLEEYVTDLWRASGAGENVILDRWHVGELVYGPLLRGGSQLRPAMARHVELLMDRLGVARVVLSPPLDVLHSRVAERGDDLVDVDQLPTLKSFYDDYAAREGWFVPDQSDYHLVQNVVTLGATLQRATEPLDAFTSYVGPIRPKTLLVGESRDKVEFPSAFTPFVGSTSELLLTGLEKAGMTSQYGMADVYNENLTELHNTLGNPRVIALGRSTFRRCQTAGLDPIWLGHPEVMRVMFDSNPVEWLAFANEIKAVHNA
jgi:hypothetical protein